MICTQCGTASDPAALHCSRCNSDLSGPDVPTSSSDDLATATGAAFPIPNVSADGLLPGHKFGTRYTIIKKLGAGGMGAVYQAWDESLGIPVALKLIRLDPDNHASTQELEARFKRELLLARQVTHPNVVRIHDLGELGTTKYLTMAYVEGADLSSTVRRDGRLSVGRSLAIIRQVAEGLAAAHRQGIVHRDLKPANVMLTNEGQALLTDFGIARAMDGATSYTSPGAIIGTLDYMAPEQVLGQPADRRSDVYALGLIFYEMLAGARPLPAGGGGFSDLIAKVQRGPVPIEQVVPEVPSEVRRILGRCLEKNPDARYPSAVELADDLRALAPDGTATLRALSAPQRSRLPAAAAVGLLIAVAALAGWWFLSVRDPQPPAPATAHEPVSVLIANFANKTGDAVFDGSLEQALSLGLEGTPFITSHSRSSAAAAAAKLRPGTVLDESAAQLVAVREGLNVIVAGSIAADGAGYQLEARAVRPASGEVVTSVNARAPNKGAVLEAVASLAAALRAALGDTRPMNELQAESFSAGSIEAVREYTVAQGLATNRKNEQAIEHYRQALSHDPNFGRAYAGWAVSAFDMGRRAEAEEIWKKALSLIDRMTEREKYRTLGSYYLAVAGNYDQAVEAYRNLVEKYPADRAGHNNLALAYFYKQDFQKAREYGKRAIEVYPDSLKFRNNYALYAMYAGDFQAAALNAQQVLKEDAGYDAAYLPIAMAALSSGNVAEARAAYERARGVGPAGASLAAIGLGDLALFEGKTPEAIATLERGLADDGQARNSYGVTTKTVALAEAHIAAGAAGDGLKLLEPLLAKSSSATIAVPAARLFAATRKRARVLDLANMLDSRTQPMPKAYARIIRGELALHERRFNDAIGEFAAAIKAADLWLARLNLGIAYVEAGRYAEAISELEAASKRRGEATALFFDDIPTYRYAAVLPYWLGRAQQGLNSAGATASFEQFVRVRSAAAGDPLVEDARKRLDSLRAAR
jgi:tetratricopeptide (TPR) repeat protein